MEKNLIVLLICVLVVVGVWMWTRRPSEIEKRVLGIRNRFVFRGVEIWLEEGVTFGYDESVEAIAGMADCIGRSRARGYGYFPDVRIAVIRSEGKRGGIPVYKLADDSEWSEDGYMFVAGQALAERKIIVIPEQGGDLENVRRVCDYEMEHIVLFYNDRAEYERTKKHRVGDGHPIIP